MKAFIAILQVVNHARAAVVGHPESCTRDIVSGGRWRR
jgi:hypothetical protein